MKTHPLISTAAVLVWTATFTLNPQASSTFSYQGRLSHAGQAAEGDYDFQFLLFDAASGGDALAGPITNAAVLVSGGVFAVTLDFGEAVFNGDSRWLEIAVRASTDEAFTRLAPRQALWPTPYAIHALRAGIANTAHSVPDGSIAGAQLASGQVVRSLNNLTDEIVLEAGTNIVVTEQGNQMTISATVAEGPPGETGPPGAPGEPGPAGDSHWGISGSDTSYLPGRVGVGIEAPEHRLDIRDSAPAPAVFARNLGTGAALRGAAVEGHGLVGESEGANSGGVYGHSTGGHGVIGRSDTEDGVVGSTESPEKSGVFGRSQLGYGVSGRSDAVSGRGVFGAATNTDGVGVHGAGPVGVLGESPAGDGVVGHSSDAAHAGVSGHNPLGVGVKGSSGNDAGVVGTTSASDASGVLGQSEPSVGVAGRSTHNDGVVGWTGAANRSGVFGNSAAGAGVSGRSSENDGILGVTSSANAAHAGIHARNEGDGPAVYSEGDLYVTGKYRGNIGPSGGAPFPRPAFNSGWIEVTAPTSFTLGVDQYLPVSEYDNDNFFVDMMTKAVGFAGNETVGQGADNWWEYTAYHINNDNSIRVAVHDFDGRNITHVRIRVWYIE